MKIILNYVIISVLITGIPIIASAQPYEGAGFTFSYTSGKGDWENFNSVLHEYRNTYPYFTDNGDLSEKKYGLSFGFFVVEDRKFVQGYLGGIKGTAWSCGSDCETYVVKSQYLYANVGYFSTGGKS